MGRSKALYESIYCEPVKEHDYRDLELLLEQLQDYLNLIYAELY